MQHIDKDLFEDRLESFIEDEEDSLKKDKIRSLTQKLEEAKWDVDEVLRSVVPAIEEEDLRDNCRRLLIAAKHDVDECCNFYPDQDAYVDEFFSEKCVLIQYSKNHTRPHSSTAVLTPDGRIIIPEGLISINGRSMWFSGYFDARKADDEGKFGLVSQDGKFILPCIFDGLDNKETIVGHYKGVDFHFVMLREPLVGSNSKNYKISEKLYLNVSCLGRDNEFEHFGAVAVSKKNDEPLNPEEAFEYEKAVKAELYSILDEHYRADLE